MRIFILTLSLVLVFSITLETSCARGDRVEELEKRVATLEGETTTKGSIPQVIEKTIPIVLRTVGYPEWQENQSLKFRLETGDKIDGEVIVIGGTTNDMICTVKDPYGNVSSQFSTRTHYSTYTSKYDPSNKQTITYLESTQKYPWRFAFVASTSGEYVLVS